MVPRSVLSRALLGTLLVGTLLAGAAAGSVTASPRPIAVCEPCDRSFVSAAYGHGVDVRIEHSTATMRVHRNGTATWIVENRLNASAAAAFRRNETLRRSVAEEVVAIHDGRVLSTSVDGDTVRLRYRTPDAATDAPGGVLRVDYFRDDPGLRVYTGLGADRLTLVAPEGMVVEHGLPGADVSDSGRRMTATAFESEGDGPFVTLVPEGSPLGPVWSLVAIAIPLGSVVGRNLLVLVTIPTLVFAGGVRVLAWAAPAAGLDTATPTPDWRALAVVGLGVVALLHPLYAGFVVAGSTPSLVAGAAGLIGLGSALAVPDIRNRLSFARLAGLVVAAFAVALVVGFGLRALSVGDLTVHGDAAVVRSTLPALPVYAITLVGYAAAHSRVRRGLAAAAGTFALVLVTTFPILSQGGTLYFLGVALGVAGGIVGAVVGLPLFALGYGLPGSDDPARDGSGADEATASS
ncbi:MAG: hypothetical protein ABEJ73_00545 [Haloplanus sp.]